MKATIKKSKTEYINNELPSLQEQIYAILVGGEPLDALKKQVVALHNKVNKTPPNIR